MRPRTPNIIQHEDVAATSSTAHIPQQPHLNSEDEIDRDEFYYNCHIDRVVASSSDVLSESPEVEENAHPQHRKRRRRRFDALNDENDVEDVVDDVDYPAATNIQPPINVPQPQIQSDSKKTSSPRRYRLNTNRTFKVTLLFHLFSLFACAASTRFVRSNSQPSAGNSQCKGFNSFLPKNETHDSEKTNPICSTWSADLIENICNATNRASIISEIYLFTNYTPPLSLFDIFLIDPEDGNPNNKKVLKNGVNGTHCIYGDKKECTVCFKTFDAVVSDMDDAFYFFDSTLSRFDCLPATNTSTATRPFSPNATCHNCKLWYRRWLLVQKLEIWEFPPCINWCYYTQLACPHLAPYKVWDYAGHPSFQCRDMDIDSWRQECDCVHPCDVKGVVPPGTIGNEPSIRHDYFAAEVHCKQRKKECQRQADLKNSSNTTTTTPKPASSDSTTNSMPTSTSIKLNSWTTPRLFHYFLLILLWMLYV